MPYILPPDEVPLYYEETGHGKNILLIHGGAASTQFWKRQMPELSRSFHVVAIDLRGHGNSGKTDDGNNIAQFARDLRHTIETLQLDRVVPVGWSVGSKVVWSYIQQFGVERLAGFVDVDQPPYRFTVEQGLEELLKELRTHKFRAHRDRLKSFLATPQPDEELHWMTCEMMKTPTGVYCSLFEDSWQSDFGAVLPQVTIPALICGSTHGLLHQDTAQRMVESMPRAKLVMFDSCSHMLFWEQADKFNREVGAFVESVAG